MAAHEPPRRSYAIGLARSFLATEFLVLATWNPSGTSYLDWLRHAARPTPTMAAVGIALLTGHVAVTRMATVALGVAGLLATGIAAGSLILVAAQLRLIEPRALLGEPVFWLSLWALALAIGLTWAKVQKRASGQRDVLKYPP